MSHFVSTGANFDDLNAQLLQRRSEAEEQDDAENQEQAIEEYDQSETNDGTIKARPISTASTLDPDDGSRRVRAGSFARRPLARHTASSSSTPYMSRKNSEEDLPSLSPSIGRPRKSTDNESRKARFSSLQQRSRSPSSSRPTSPAQRPRHSLAKEVAFSKEVDEVRSSSSSVVENLPRTNSGFVEPSYPRHRHHHNHHFANSNQQDVTPHHVLSIGHHARLKHSINASEVALPRKLGTWDGVFMPVSLNVSLLRTSFRDKTGVLTLFDDRFSVSFYFFGLASSWVKSVYWVPCFF